MENKDLELQIIREIKKCINEKNLGISLTPIMYKKDDMSPTIGVRVKENDTWVRKFTIQIIEEI